MEQTFNISDRVRFPNRFGPGWEFGEVIGAERDGDQISYTVLTDDSGRAFIAQENLEKMP